MARGNRWRNLAALARTLALTLTAAGGAMADAPDQPSVHPLAASYARYLAAGRGEVEVHWLEAGADATARVLAQADGSFRCEVSGLHEAAPEVLIHETTHCQVVPWLGRLREAADTPAGIDALVVLTAECISDARAVIEVFRADGAAAAQQLVQRLRPQRERAASAGHATAPALDAALAATLRDAAALAEPVAAFEAALRIGSAAARQQFEARGQSAPAELHEAIAATLRRASTAFRNGRYANTAFTLHTAEHRHYFVASDGSLGSQPVLGAESAQGLAALQSLLQGLREPEERLAAQWLQRQGRLDATRLQQTSRVFAQFLRSMAGGQADTGGRIARRLSALIENSPRGLDLGGLLDEAADSLRDSLRDNLRDTRVAG